MTADSQFLLVLALLLGARAAALPCDCNLQSMECSGRELTDVPEDICSDTTLLSLNRNNIVKLYSTSFSTFSNLQGLVVNENSIYEVEQDTFAGLSSLSLLGMSGNLLRSLSGLTFPAKLTILRVEDNLLSQLNGASLGSLRELQELHLARNAIASVDISGSDALPSLQYLDLSDNRLTSLSADAFATWAGASGGWTLLLDGNRLTAPAEGDPLLRQGTLTALSAKRCGLHRLPARALVELPQLNNIDLTENSLMSLTGLLDGLTRLDTLNLTATSLVSLAAADLSPATELRALRLDVNPLSALEPAALNPLLRLERVDVSDTPLACACGPALDRLLAWAADRGVQLEAACDGGDPCDAQGNTTLGGGDDFTVAPQVTCGDSTHCDDGQECCRQPVVIGYCTCFGLCVEEGQCGVANPLFSSVATVLLLAAFVVFWPAT